MTNSRFLAGAVAFGGSILCAIWYLAGNAWFGVGDLRAMVIWSAPLGALEYLLLGVAIDRLAGSSAWLRYLVLVLGGAAIGILWSIIVLLLLGPAIGGFSFPVPFCWFAGGLLGGASAAVAAKPRTWPVAVTLVAIVAVAASQLNAYARAPAPRIRVVIQPSATPAEVQRMWTHVLGQSTGVGDESYMLPGIHSVADIGSEGESEVLEVSFRKRLPRDERERLVELIRRSPLVLRVDSVPSGETPRIRISSDY